MNTLIKNQEKRAWKNIFSLNPPLNKAETKEMHRVVASFRRESEFKEKSHKKEKNSYPISPHPDPRRQIQKTEPKNLNI